METAFIVAGMVLVILFCAWIVVARPMAERWKVTIVNALLIVMCIIVLIMGFILNDKHKAALSAANVGDGEESAESSVSESDKTSSEESVEDGSMPVVEPDSGPGISFLK